MEISSDIAQEIVLQLKNVLSQEINFMNSKSIIIASTDKNRIDHYHSGAATVLATKKPLVIDDSKSYIGSKHGINMPIDYFALTGPSISNPSPPIHESSPPLLSARICTSRQSIRTSSPLTSLFYV
ncbi:hypothetical protein BKP56_11265 [Marinilactibacillus sp. 15R]|uniref:sugar diacid recognition domain-containing protein n=1 Tax=Marinilactibacillus sp. 15R TaxID=1911586 RepID=UPI00090B398D|nr:sugar diacid recognition domain-containing protein [Marinilactibacillus sp. 15R]API89803.1 hypothetical protein BKP56_11265 [Marinilactibacillus sp. 15R]